LKADKNIISMT